MYQERQFGAIEHSRAKGARAMYFPDLLREYKNLLKQMRADGVTSGELYREVQQAIQWMETGYDPAEVRAKLRVDAYTMDLDLMQRYCDYVFDAEMMMPEQLQTVKKAIASRWMPGEEDTMRADEFVKRHFSDFRWQLNKSLDSKEKIVGALKGLTDNEKAAFIAIEAEKMKYEQVAKLFGVEKGTVQSYVKRAKQKIRMNLAYGTQDSLFDDIA